MNDSPVNVYKNRLGPGLLNSKKIAYKNTWNNLVKPMAEKGKIFELDYVEQLDIGRLFENTLDVTELPYNKVLRQSEEQLLTSLDSCELSEENSSLLEKAEDIFVGYYPIDDVNAYVSLIDNKKYLILVNEGLLYSIYKLCFLFVAGLEIESQSNEIISESIQIEILQDNAKYFFDRYVDAGELPSSKGMYLCPERMKLVNLLSRSSIDFLIAHEYAHIINEDLELSKREKREINGIDLSVCERNHKEEIEADILAYRMISHSSNLDREIIIAGIVVFFLAANLLEDLLDVDDETHPESMTRLDLLAKSHEDFTNFNDLASDAYCLINEILMAC